MLLHDVFYYKKKLQILDEINISVFLKNLISKLFIDDYYSLLFGKCQENRGCIHPL